MYFMLIVFSGLYLGLYSYHESGIDKTHFYLIGSQYLFVS